MSTSGFQIEDYQDVVETTLRAYEQRTWSEIVIDNQRHIAMPYILVEERTEEQSGEQISFNARFYSNNAAKNVKIGATDAPTMADTMKKGVVPWRHTETHWAVEERELAANREPARSVSMLDTKRVDALVSLAEKMEDNFWTSPGSTTSDAPYGIPYWIVQSNTDTTGAFQGGRPTGYTGNHPGGFDPDTYTRWKNWSRGYTDIEKNDLVKKMRQAAYKCDFRSPVPGPFSNMPSGNAFTGNSGYGGALPRCLHCSTYDVVSAMEEILESQNDNLGNDVASKDGMVMFRRNPVLAVPWLDNNTTNNPMYGLNMDSFGVVFLAGEYMRPTRVKPHPGQHRTLVQYFDNSYNFTCNDRRRQYVLYQP